MTSTGMQEWILRLIFVLVGLIHLPPLAGLMGQTILEKAYGIKVSSPSLQILLQHRALLFALLAMACFAAAFYAPWRQPVWIAAMLSAGSFVLLSWLTPEHSQQISKVVMFDIVAVVLLLLAGVIYFNNDGFNS
jgi:hypothetical protein